MYQFLFTTIDTSEIILGLLFMITGGLIAPISIVRYRYSNRKTRLWFFINIVLGAVMLLFLYGVVMAWLFPS